MDRMSDFTGWIPIRAYPKADDYWIDWLYLGSERVDAPFFQESIQPLISQPFHQAFRRQTRADEMVEWARRSPGLQPNGFIFHASRCGSTLISQMFASSTRNIVLSEPPPLEALLQARHGMPEWTLGRQRDALQALVSAWGQATAGNATPPRQHLVVKADPWSIMDSALVRAAWPAVPCVFVYRDPIEILVSQLRHRASFLLPGMLIKQPAIIPPQMAYSMDSAEYCARMLGAILRGMVDHYDPRTTLLVNYSELPQAVTELIAPFLGISINDMEAKACASTAMRHAKRPSEPFLKDSASKQADADDYIRRLAATWMEPHYMQLEALRREQSYAQPRSERKLEMMT
jgi:hypothetical protein